MINIVTKSCEKNGCNSAAQYNFEGEKKPMYCLQHKAIEMVNVISKLCEHIGCYTIPSFNFIGMKAKYCSNHKEDGMINLFAKKCNYVGCIIEPAFNFEYDKTPKCCFSHKEDGMINIKTTTICKYTNCNKPSRYNIKYETIPKFCINHKTSEMVNIKHRICEEQLCNKIAIYNFNGEKHAKLCSTHKESEMTNVKHILCKTYLCNTRINNKKYEGYCFRCFMYTFPDKPIARNYKTKEFSVVDYITKEFPEYAWITDKSIQGGCSKKRPDLLLDLGYHIVIVEIDENQHKSYECSCDNKRIMELSQDVGHRPIVFIRFNPDDYVDQDGKNVKSCWSITKQTGIIKIGNTDEWITRLKNLSNQIKYWTNPENTSEKTVEIVELYYDQNL
jgi:hypothetical protein